MQIATENDVPLIIITVNFTIPPPPPILMDVDDTFRVGGNNCFVVSLVCRLQAVRD